MAKIAIPFETAEESGVYLDLDLSEGNLVASFIPKEPSAIPDVTAAAAYAIEHPLQGKPLTALVRRGDRVVIVTENQFRAAPAKEILPPVVDLIQEAGGEVSIVIGNGKVPPLTPQEIEHKLGKEILAKGIGVECNDVSQPDRYVFLGTTTRGVPLFVHRSVVQADVKITLSTTQATLWGYGGSGMIIPAVSGNETIEINHLFSLPRDCRPGNNGCHMQEDKYEAAQRVGIDMGIHVIVNNRSEVSYIGAGDFVEAHKAAIKAYDQAYRFKAFEFTGAPADIVVTGSSAPTDHLFFHTGWAVVNCDPLCKDGGTIIQATPCPGYGSWPGFALMDLMKEYMPPSPENAARALRAFYGKERELWAGCIWWKIYEVMTRKQVIIVTRRENLAMCAEAGLDATDSVEKAFERALERHGRDARVAFVPYGRYSIFDVG